MLLPSIVLIVISLTATVIILFFFTRLADEIKYGSQFALVVISIMIILQIVFYVQPISELNYYSNKLEAIEYFFFIISTLAIICVVYLLSIYSKLSERSKILTVLLAAFQTAIFMTAASFAGVSIFLKLLLNFYYLLIPALILHELKKYHLSKTENKQ